MKSLIAVLATAALAAPALAQAPTEWPVCSKDVRDRCIQGPAAQRREAQVFKPGAPFRDFSATLTPKQAAAGMTKPE